MCLVICSNVFPMHYFSFRCSTVVLSVTIKIKKVAQENKGGGGVQLTSDVKKTVFFRSCFLYKKIKKKIRKKLFFIVFFFVFWKYGLNINTQVETTLLWDLFSIYDTVSNYFTSLLLI